MCINQMQGLATPRGPPRDSALTPAPLSPRFCLSFIVVVAPASSLQDVRSVLALGLDKAGKANYDLANGMQVRRALLIPLLSLSLSLEALTLSHAPDPRPPTLTRLSSPLSLFRTWLPTHVHVQHRLNRVIAQLRNG
jgi:hypothetical protein